MNHLSEITHEQHNAPLAAPSREQWQAFWQTSLQSAGIISLSAGAIFFLAANWQHMSRWQRFGLFEGLFVLCAVFAWIKPASHVIGALGLTGLTVLTGVLFGLYGQTFQTGANTYELFFAWAALSVPFAWLSRQPGLWAFWSVILNTALALYAQTPSTWIFFSQYSDSVNWMVLGLINLSLAWIFLQYLQSQWLYRFLLVCAAGFMTTGSIGLAFGSQGGQTIIVLYLVACAALVAFAWHAKPKDIFPITLLAFNLIITSTTLFARHGELGDIGMFFALSFWVLISSGAAFSILLKLHRLWHSQADAMEHTL